jgi:hypothetical protein
MAIYRTRFACLVAGYASVPGRRAAWLTMPPIDASPTPRLPAGKSLVVAFA